MDLIGEASIPGMPGIRAGARNAAMAADLARSFAEERSENFPAGPDGVVCYAHLALSGGGANGAFGAGRLNGWTKTGTRSVFKIGTGVSTGALRAPFAFLGPEEDDALREFYTTTRSRNIFQVLSIVPQLLGGESLADTGPLAALIARHIDSVSGRRGSSLGRSYPTHDACRRILAAALPHRPQSRGYGARG